MPTLKTRWLTEYNNKIKANASFAIAKDEESAEFTGQVPNISFSGGGGIGGGGMKKDLPKGGVSVDVNVDANSPKVGGGEKSGFGLHMPNISLGGGGGGKGIHFFPPT